MAAHFAGSVLFTTGRKSIAPSRPPFYTDKRWWLAGGVAVVAIVALVISTSGGSSGNKVSVAQFCTDANQAAAAVNSRTNSNLAPLGKSELTSLAAQLRKLAGEAPALVSVGVAGPN